MLSLDLRTIVVMSGILALLLGGVLLALRRSYPRHFQGLGHWAAAPLLVAAAAFLISARGNVPDWLSIVGANLLLLAGVLLFHLGSQLFFGLRPAYRFWLPMLAVWVLPLVWFGLIRPDFNARVQLVCSAWVVILLANARVIWRHGPENFATRYTVIVMLVHAFIIALRGLATLLPLSYEGIFVPTRIQTIYAVGNALMTIAFAVGLVLLIAERMRSEFQHLAMRDSLTGAVQRRVLLEACEQELARCRRHGRSMALLMMDIDHFKTINDTHGHQTGDHVLVNFVDRVSALLRRPDLLARFGGEEFVLQLPETTLEEAVAVAERIRQAVAVSQEGLPPLTVSIGVTTNRPDEERVESLLARADRALYKAKLEGRNRVETA